MTHRAQTVTTVIPTYRRPHLLRRAIKSALIQTYPDVKVCVCDNASGDETATVVASMSAREPRIQYFCQPSNIGSYPNFNFGIHQVETPFFSLLSDDDALAPDFYTQAMKGFELYPQAMFVIMATLVIDEDSNILSPPVQVRAIKCFTPEEGFEGLIKVAIPNTWTGIVFRKEIIDQIGLVDTEAGPFADAGFVWLAAARFPFVVVPGLAAVLMSHQESTSGTVQPIDGSWPIWWERMIGRVEGDPLVSEQLRSKVRQLAIPNFKRLAFYRVMQALGRGQVEAAKKSAEGLGDCGYKFMSYLLVSLVRGCVRIPFFRSTVMYIKRTRARRLHKYREQLTAQYKNEIAFLERPTLNE